MTNVNIVNYEVSPGKTAHKIDGIHIHMAKEIKFINVTVGSYHL